MLYGRRKRGGAGNELVRACEQYLFVRRVFAYRNNSGAVKMESGSFVRFGAKGSPDIVAVIHGIYTGIECKMGTGKQSPAQKDFQAAVERAGGRYWLIRDLDQLRALVEPLIA